jgi:hypothetical protein
MSGIRLLCLPWHLRQCVATMMMADGSSAAVQQCVCVCFLHTAEWSQGSLPRTFICRERYSKKRRKDVVSERVRRGARRNLKLGVMMWNVERDGSRDDVRGLMCAKHAWRLLRGAVARAPKGTATQARNTHQLFLHPAQSLS